MKDTEKQLNITYLMNKHGLSQNEFAERIGVTQQAVSNWIQQKNGMDEETKERIKQMFGVSNGKYPEWLLTKPFPDYTYEELEEEIPQLAELASDEDNIIKQLLEESMWVVIALHIINHGNFEWLDLTIEIGMLANLSYSRYFKAADKRILQERQVLEYTFCDEKMKSIFRRADQGIRELQVVFVYEEDDSDCIGKAYTKSLSRLNYHLDYYTDVRPYLEKYGVKESE